MGSIVAETVWIMKNERIRRNIRIQIIDKDKTGSTYKDRKGGKV
jgi:hypothetical protein